MNFRKSARKDLPCVIQLIADDKLGSLRERYEYPLPASYYEAFDRINADPNQELIVVENDQFEIIGTLQLSFIPGLTYQGGIRAQVEAVRVREGQRGKGIGQEIFKWVIARAKARGAHMLQLTSNKQRPEAIHFYEKLGFKASHEGMKMNL